jgi:dinuclear metal center YbgI/SA1388 family protein
MLASRFLAQKMPPSATRDALLQAFVRAFPLRAGVIFIFIGGRDCGHETLGRKEEWQKKMKRDELVEYLENLLNIAQFGDHSINGLQVQGKEEVRTVGLATDAALIVYEKAAAAGCDFLFVHHGLVWGGLKRIAGRSYEHIKALLGSELNLFACHLPLDLHPKLGNNAQLASLVGLSGVQPFGEYHGVTIGFEGVLREPSTAGELAARWQAVIGGTPKLLEFGPKEIRTVGIVSGGGSGMLEEAIEKQLDCFITGEGEHKDFHLAREGKINVVYLGHYASETLGVKAVGEELKTQFGLETVFIDEPSPF